MSELPSVSVVIPVFNGQKTIGDTLASLTAQTGAPAETEIIVVDNGSTDQTTEIVGKFDVTLLHQPKKGPSAARNLGLEKSQADVIAYLDADTLPTRRWVAEMAEAFRDPDTVIAAGRTLGFMPQTGSEMFAHVSGLYDVTRMIEKAPVAFVPSLNLAVRREAAIASGGWSEDLTIAEDVDFSMRVMQKFPAPIAYREKAVLFHRNRETDEGLLKMASDYGAGAARLYPKHPEILKYDLKARLAITKRLTKTTLRVPLAATLRLFGRTTKETVAFCRYDRRWNRAFWKAFLAQMKRQGGR